MTFNIHLKTKKYYADAFTLAEILITLGIIGVIAALTIPNLIAGYEKQAAEVRLKKDFSTFANALRLAENEYGNVEDWYVSGMKGRDYFDRLKPYLKLAVEPCYDGSRCFNKNPGSYYDSIYFRLQDGSCAMFSKSVSTDKDPKIYVYFLTKCKPAGISGKTVFEFSLLNFKNLNIKSNVTCGTPICYWNNQKSTCPSPNSDPVWKVYNCSMKFAQDGFTFKDDYQWEKQKGINDPINNMLKINVKGWN